MYRRAMRAIAAALLAFVTLAAMPALAQDGEKVVQFDPEAWRIIDGKLYLNYSTGIQDRWAKDIPGNIAKGDANWPEITANLAK